MILQPCSHRKLLNFLNFLLIWGQSGQTEVAL